RSSSGNNTTMTRLLVVTDFQYDFVSGSLGFPKAQELEEPIAKKIEEYRANGDEIVFTLDTHDA
ncbi:MAG: isochorismatase family protein, partial [Methanocorpusculum sp.]|nr:isochorismatase family protein [Candidatus Methanocorpusculum equi]